MDWVNELIKNKPEVIKNCEQVLAEVMNTGELETEIAKLQEESDALYKKLHDILKSGGKDPDIDALMKSSFVDDKRLYEELCKRIQEKHAELVEKGRREVECKRFLEQMGKLEEPICEFSEKLWTSLVGKAVVGEDEKVGRDNVYFLLYWY